MAENKELSEKQLYDEIDDHMSRQTLLFQFKPNPSLWLAKFTETVKIAQNPSKRFGLRSTFQGLRILIQRQTLRAMQNGHFFAINPETNSVEKILISSSQIIESAKKTVLYTNKDINSLSPKKLQNFLSFFQSQSDEKQNDDMNVDVVNGDCLDSAFGLQSQGFNVCVLNMANAHNVGGGYQNGCGAQEENLCRRTTLVSALCNHISKGKKLDSSRKWTYPIPSNGVIYTPNVFVMRANEMKGYEFLCKPYKIAIVSAAMLQRPTYNQQTFEYEKQMESKIKMKLKSVLRVAHRNGHDAVVLSAWGCGAFKNPPLGQSKLWQQVLNENEFKGKFKKIVFAIFDDHNTGKDHNPFGNFLPFVETFGITKKRIDEFVQQQKSEKDKSVLEALCDILMGNEKETNYEMIFGEKLKGNRSALSVLYCAGFKWSSDGTRLELEAKRRFIAKGVYELLNSDGSNEPNANVTYIKSEEMLK